MKKPTFEPLIIVETHDGCVMRKLTTAIPNEHAWKRTVRELLNAGFKLEELDMMYAGSGRLASWTWKG